MSTKPHIPFKPILEGYLGCHPAMKRKKAMDQLRSLKDLDALRQQGWHFVIWLTPKTCIIQGSPDDGTGDWAFDVQAQDLQTAIQKALVECGG